jgi:integrase/recombinase XerC
LASLFKPNKSTYTLADGSCRTPDGKRVTKDTLGAVKTDLGPSDVYYGKYKDAHGTFRRVKLCADKSASKQILAKLVNDARLAEHGMVAIFDAHHKRPLLEHLADFEAALLAKGTSSKQVGQVISRIRRILDGCGFTFISDLSASRVQTFLADFQQIGLERVSLDQAKNKYTKAELAAALGVKPSTVTALVKRYNLEAVGKGKRRRYLRSTAEALLDRLPQGRSVQTLNFYLQAIKQFCTWLTRDRRTPDNPLAHLAGKNPKTDRRHDRRPLSEDELRLVLKTTRASRAEFRGLAGVDRYMLYVTACLTGLRKAELTNLTPVSFNLDATPPTIAVRAGYTKNRNPVVQPLPVEFAEVLRNYLMGRPDDQSVWPGTWHERAATMFRKDLEAAGIPYAVDGPDGPLYADFHSLRHAFVGLLDKSGASLKQAMQLARHSDPKLTMARYGRAQLHDLAAAIDRLPCLVATESKPALSATGTQGPEAEILPARLDRALTKPMLPDGVCVITPENSPPASSKKGGSEEPRKRQEMRTPESDCQPLRKLRPAGFEPATLGLGNRCSIP